ncbi:MAG: ECF transporter S component [Coriobacteriia bacterium]|nr:ECF transporter S component [Coriobacteriia bacterium]
MEKGQAQYRTSRWGARQLATMALLTAIGIILSFIEPSIMPAAPFLKYDASNVPAVLGGLAYGPGAGCLIGIISAWVHALLSGNYWGAIVNTVVIIGYVVPVSLIYRASRGLGRSKLGEFKNSRMVSAFEASAKNQKRLINGNLALILGFVISSLLSIVLALAMNLLITPIYTAAPLSSVVAMIVPILLPFNLIKVAINSVLAFVLMKSLHSFIK